MCQDQISDTNKETRICHAYLGPMYFSVFINLPLKQCIEMKCKQKYYIDFES